MKKLISVVLLLVMAVSLCACGSKETEKPEPTKSVQDQVRSAVENRAIAYCVSMYSYKNFSISYTNIEKNSDGTYDVYGYVTLTDNYGDKYRGKYNASVSYSDYNGYWYCDSFNLQTPTKS